MRRQLFPVLAFLYASHVVGDVVDDCFATCGSAVVYASECSTDTSCLCGSGSDFVTTATQCLDCAGPDVADIWMWYEESLVGPLATCGLATSPGGTAAATPTTPSTTSTTTLTSTSVTTSTITSTTIVTTSST
ncbi:hypothetical protein V1506DRAFT_441235, partial [Lipomyces tetrasporus]